MPIYVVILKRESIFLWCFRRWRLLRVENQKLFKRTFELMVCYGHKFSNKLNFLATTSLLRSLSLLSVAQTCNSKVSFFERRVWQQVHKQNSHKTENVYWFCTILMDFYLRTKKVQQLPGSSRLMLFFFEQKLFRFRRSFTRKTTRENPIAQVCLFDYLKDIRKQQMNNFMSAQTFCCFNFPLLCAKVSAAYRLSFSSNLLCHWFF